MDELSLYTGNCTTGGAGILRGGLDDRIINEVSQPAKGD